MSEQQPSPACHPPSAEHCVCPSKQMAPVPMSHDWNANDWNWPLQHHDGIVKVKTSPYHFEVGFDCAHYTPNEIEVGVLDGGILQVHCMHAKRVDGHGEVAREVLRSYRMPDNTDPASVKSHLDKRGVLHVSGVRHTSPILAAMGLPLSPANAAAPPTTDYSPLPAPACTPLGEEPNSAAAVALEQPAATTVGAGATCGGGGTAAGDGVSANAPPPLAVLLEAAAANADGAERAGVEPSLPPPPPAPLQEESSDL